MGEQWENKTLQVLNSRQLTTSNTALV